MVYACFDFVFQFKKRYIFIIYFYIYGHVYAGIFFLVFVCRADYAEFFFFYLYFFLYVCGKKGTRKFNVANVQKINWCCVYSCRRVFFCVLSWFQRVFYLLTFEWEKNTLHDQMILLYTEWSDVFFFGVCRLLFEFRLSVHDGKKLHDTFFFQHGSGYIFFLVLFVVIRSGLYISSLYLLFKEIYRCCWQWFFRYEWQRRKIKEITRRQLILWIGVNIIGDIDFTLINALFHFLAFFVRYFIMNLFFFVFTYSK